MKEGSTQDRVSSSVETGFPRSTHFTFANMQAQLCESLALHFPRSGDFDAADNFREIAILQRRGATPATASYNHMCGYSRE